MQGCCQAINVSGTLQVAVTKIDLVNTKAPSNSLDTGMLDELCHLILRQLQLVFFSWVVLFGKQDIEKCFFL